MIAPMKKVSLVLLNSEKKAALKKLRKLGLLHIEITEGSGAHLIELKESVDKLERAIAVVSTYFDKAAEQKNADVKASLAVADKVFALADEKTELAASLKFYQGELARIESWGDIEIQEFADLANKGIELLLCEMPMSEYKRLGQSVSTVVLDKTKNSVRFAAVMTDTVEADDVRLLKACAFKLPEKSTAKIRNDISRIKKRMADVDAELKDCALHTDSMQKAIAALQKDTEFEVYETGMDVESLSEKTDKAFDVAYLVGYIPAQDSDKIKALAKENSWAIVLQDPTEEDNAPTKLQNNKFVSLIYPLTDFLGTVPGYFEYDISAWFLGFILVFFGIIFGDGGYGLLICAISGALILKSVVSKKAVPPAFWLILMMGGATVLWGILTCTWFGLPADVLPAWLGKISIPVISNVYADKIWYPFWTNGTAGLTTSQNVQTLCFALALVQLSIAHAKGIVKDRKTVKWIGSLGSIFQLMGIFYVVLSLVVNGEVFGLGLVIGGVPVGTVAIALVGIGFVMSFVFSNYEGSIKDSILASCKNIVSVLLGVVNVFSDIVSYIRLWAVGLAGSAISATVNELVSPMLGNFMLIIFAIILLVFGHGLNMILNVLSVIVHGVRLNTLEFSGHLDMSWSGHKYEPFEE